MIESLTLQTTDSTVRCFSLLGLEIVVDIFKLDSGAANAKQVLRHFLCFLFLVNNYQ